MAETHKVNIIVEVIEKNFRAFQKLGTMINDLQRIGLGLKLVRGQMRFTDLATGKIISTHKAYNKIIDGLTKGIVKQTKEQKKFYKTQARVLSSQLGIMFGAMQLQRSFSRMLAPMQDAIGLQELWGAILLENTIDAIEPTIEALEFAGGMMEYINKMTGGAFGRMLLFGKSVGTTMQALSQATLFFNGLVTGLGGIAKGGGAAANAIASITQLLTSVVLPVIFWDTDNLKLASAFMSDINRLLDKTTKGIVKQEAAVRALDNVIFALTNIFVGLGDVESKAYLAAAAFNSIKDEIKDLKLDILIKSADDAKVKSEELEDAINDVRDEIDRIKPTSLINVVNTVREAKTKINELSNSISGIPTKKTIDIEIRPRLTLGGLFRRLVEYVFGLKAINLYKQIRAGLGIRYFQGGGYVPRTMMAVLHKGEYVVPSRKVGTGVYFAPNVTINTSITSDYDVRNISKILLDEWKTELERRLV